MESIINMANCYRTKDLPVAAFLYALAKKLISTENENGRIWFVFEDKTSCEGLTDSFWRKEATINAKEYSDAIRTLKDLIFNRPIGNEDGYQQSKRKRHLC